MSVEKDPVRFGAEFGPYRSQHHKGVTLSTFKTLVWVSNLGGLLLVVVALEMMIMQQRFYWGLAAMIAGIVIALFPSNYEIVGMENEDEPTTDDTTNEDES
tara:strand:+ start:2491 stop:2793 length:303 start_codon:yes stop_codon:yes gene_type:complete